MTNTVNLSTGPVLFDLASTRYDWDRLQVETLDWSVMIIARSLQYRPAREWRQDTRVYDALDQFVPGFDAEETRLLNAITDHDVRDKPLADYQRRSARTASLALPAFVRDLASVVEGIGMKLHSVPEDLTARFSRKAGCTMCPCSPGHVLSTRLSLTPGDLACRPVDLYFRTS